ncbi:MAG: anti-sigma factor [Chromatiales bacterium]|nr:anti-sigma factor [Chromatiales bacterium]
MNLNRPGIADRLAGEYVLGTLAGAARRRFERVAAADPTLSRRVRYWEQRLAPLASEVEPVVPPPAVWSAIERRLGWTRSEPAGAGLGWWRFGALFASFAALALAVFVLLRAPVIEPPAAPPAWVAVVQDEGAKPLWLVEASEQGSRVRIRALGDAAPPAGRAYELWLLPDSGGPISLGLLPAQGMTLADGSGFGRWATASGIAVSVEPPGGSPTGAPTGPVVFQARLTRAS